MSLSRTGIRETELDSRWLKASIAGSMWAASEIVIGSFLHNLRVPFSGSILTAIGIILLISISYKWKEKGLFWRAGIICALMKTLSPSAVIFGPMIAILVEALLMEGLTRIAGHKPAGYILGAILAMSWNLVQRILTLLLFYGMSIVEVYTDLADIAERQMGIRLDMAWAPILIILIIYVIAGIISAVAGLKLGRKIALSRIPALTPGIRPLEDNRFNDPDNKKMHYSLSWLFINMILLAGSMILLNYAPVIAWLIIIPVIILIWMIKYKRASRQLLNPKFWIFFIIITLLTSFVFTRVREGDNGLVPGLVEALRMNFRAGAVILGFSAIGSELYNPRIRSYFTGTRLRNLPPALELATQSLPMFIAGIPSFRTIIRKPFPALAGVLALAERKLGEVEAGREAGNGREAGKGREAVAGRETGTGREADTGREEADTGREAGIIKQARVIIISGPLASGKTTLTKEVVELLKRNNVWTGGILSERVIHGKETAGYDLIDISSGRRIKFLRKIPAGHLERIGSYSIFPDALRQGQEILCDGKSGRIRVIDEAGRLELQDRGWAVCISRLLKENQNTIILTVRDSFLDEVIKKFEINKHQVIKASEASADEVFELIMNGAPA